MKSTFMNEKTVYGLAVRTKNSDEVNRDTSRIGEMWQRFYEEIILRTVGPYNVYGVYCDYESDESGEFTVIAGIDVAVTADAEVKIPSGNYLLFEGKGDLPDVAAETWAEVWEYFTTEECPHQRIFDTDFEYYCGGGRVELYIGIKERSAP